MVRTIMKLLPALLALLDLLVPQVSSLTGVQNNPNIFGNELNFWSKLDTGGWDVSIFVVVVVQPFYIYQCSLLEALPLARSLSRCLRIDLY